MSHSEDKKPAERSALSKHVFVVVALISTLSQVEGHGSVKLCGRMLGF